MPPYQRTDKGSREGSRGSPSSGSTVACSPKGPPEEVRPAHLPPVKGEEDEHVCTIFAIFQKDRWRAIFNMKFTNGFMKPLPFKMTGTAALRSILLEGDWMASIDLKDAW